MRRAEKPQILICNAWFYRSSCNALVTVWNSAGVRVAWENRRIFRQFGGFSANSAAQSNRRKIRLFSQARERAGIGDQNLEREKERERERGNSSSLDEQNPRVEPGCVCWQLKGPLMHARTHAPTHPRTHAPTHPRTHARACKIKMQLIILLIWLSDGWKFWNARIYLHVIINYFIGTLYSWYMQCSTRFWSENDNDGNNYNNQYI